MTSTIDQPTYPDPTPASAAELGLEVRPMAGHIGAEIFGVDLAEPLDPEVVAEIRAIWLKWKVVFFRDQHLSQEQHKAFGRRFGELAPGHPTLPAAFPEHPEILLLDNERLAMGGGGSFVESRWHTDVTFIPDPPTASILRGVIVPPYGGDTQWANLALAYERLSEPLKDLVDGLHAVHHNTLPIKRGELPGKLAKQFLGEGLRAVHPVVRVHPETGEKVLFVNPNFTSHILELTRQEGAHVLELLYAQIADPEFSVRFRWQPGSIAFWDNRATVHLVPTDVPPGMRRSMQRVTLRGAKSVGPDGAESYPLEG
ncbi:TauD/TfdA dioxygenase family protein [Embleya sp. AB8]|uniref:TauD/TfdA dioxygenase family protein n=1 Tax=Embleya sp. AB8 TaxID=3156304 RepID=UPI003C73F3B5